MKHVFTLFAAVLLAPLPALNADDKPAARLSSGEYFIRHSWSQEQGFSRPYHVNVPANPDGRKLPVLIFLHGNGGNAKDAMNGDSREERQARLRRCGGVRIPLGQSHGIPRREAEQAEQHRRQA